MTLGQEADARPRPVVGAGLALIGLGLLGASTVDAGTPYPLYACRLLVISAGTGLSMPALTLGVVTALPADREGLGSGLGTSAREVGAAGGSPSPAPSWPPTPASPRAWARRCARSPSWS